ncbi:hypothetical protein H5410_030127 [Solanum commersonii]|uniref:Uncharacterized protein n=1 Tax=Solanum commersonii TaxID=4109 RepID=A0A9J5YF83_SOLCO|nr:hypothetical protein H5410_030127 [Solanum commersonii]
MVCRGRYGKYTEDAKMVNDKQKWRLMRGEERELRRGSFTLLSDMLGYSPSMKCGWMAQDRGASAVRRWCGSSMLSIFVTPGAPFEEVKATSWTTTSTLVRVRLTYPALTPSSGFSMVPAAWSLLVPVWPDLTLRWDIVRSGALENYGGEA